MSFTQACVASTLLAAVLAPSLFCCNPPSKHNNGFLARQHNHQSHNTLSCGSMPRQPQTALHPELELLLQDLAHNGWVIHSCTCPTHVCTNETIDASSRQGHKGGHCQAGNPVSSDEHKWLNLSLSDQLQVAAAPAGVPAPACTAGTSAAGAVAVLCLSRQLRGLAEALPGTPLACRQQRQGSIHTH